MTAPDAAPADGSGGLFQAYCAVVPAEQADYNDHLNVAWYPVHFEHATRHLFERLDISRAYREATGHAMFAVEQHLVYRGELRVGAAFSIASRILGLRPKLLWIMHFMRDAAGETVATTEILFIHVDLATRRSAAFPDPVLARLRPMAEAHARLPWPDDAGRRITLR